MKKIIMLLIIITSIFGVISVYASTSGEIEQDMIREGIEMSAGESYNPPFGKKDAIGENISTWSGNLSLTQTDLILPGKNGHDLVIKREYSNQREDYFIYQNDINLYYTTLTRPAFLYYDENGVGYYILFYSESQMIENAPETLNCQALTEDFFTYEDSAGNKAYPYERFKEGDLNLTRDKNADPIYIQTDVRSKLSSGWRTTSLYEIGNGWKITLPFLVKIDSYSERVSSECVHLRKIGEFHNGKGGIYSYTQWDLNYKGYEPCSLDIEDTELYTAHNVYYYDTYDETVDLTYNRTVTDKNGETMYFNSRGAIVAIDDKYGNRIKFEYNSSNKLSKIIDSYGREITVGSTNGMISSISYENRQITYTKTYRETDYRDILTVKDAEGNETIYESQKKEPMYSSCWFNYNDGRISGGNDRRNRAHNIVKIQYPTGATTEYVYQESLVSLGEILLMKERYKVKSKKDISNAKVNNYYTYEYINEFEGVSVEELEEIAEYNGKELEEIIKLGAVKRQSDGYTKIDRYNPYGKKIVEQQANIWNSGNSNHLKYTENSGYYEKETTYVYTDDEEPESSPRTITEKQYNTESSEYISAITQYEYDDKQNITKETKDDYTVNYTYGTDSIMLTQTYKRDATHETHIENTLYNNTADPDDPLNGKCVEWTKTYERIYNNDGNLLENNLKNKTKYQYDQNGNITAIHQWDDEGNENITHTTHTYNTNKTYKLETYVANVTDADGQNPQTIKQTSNYDVYGNLATSKDGNNNNTSYTYDKLGRVKTETYADGTSKTYTYNDAQNYIIVQNENRNKQKIQYDGLGNLKATYIYNPDNSTWQKQTENTYDNIGRKQTETLYRKYTEAGQVAEKYTITYTYNSDDTVNTQTTTDISGNIIKKISYTYDYGVNDTINGKIDKYNKITIALEGDNTITPAPIKQYYDKWGKLVKEEIDHDENGTTKTYTTTYQYDYMGNKTAEKDPRAHDENWTQEATATYTYDHANRIIKQTNIENQSIQTTYDTLGRVKTQTDYKGNTTIYTYDKLGRLKTTETPFDGNNTTKTKHYYDNNGNKTKEKQQTNKIGEPETYNTTEYGYDNRCICQVKSSHNFNRKSTTYV